MSFLNKLFGKNVPVVRADDSSVPVNSASVAQLDVDVFLADDSVTIYAHVPGSSHEDIEISVEGNSDIIRIEGKRKRPRPQTKSKRGHFGTEECVWGEFYRRIILPAPVDIENADALVEDGLLVLHLPLQE